MGPAASTRRRARSTPCEPPRKTPRWIGRRRQSPGPCSSGSSHAMAAAAWGGWRAPCKWFPEILPKEKTNDRGQAAFLHVVGRRLGALAAHRALGALGQRHRRARRLLLAPADVARLPPADGAGAGGGPGRGRLHRRGRRDGGGGRPGRRPALARRNAAVAEAISSIIEKRRLQYEQGLFILGTLGNNAPFVGLFGTVLGIIRAFADLSMSNKAGAQTVMAGISEALVATAVGLFVAIPAVLAFNVFQRLLKRVIGRSNALAHAIAAGMHVEKEAD